MLKGDVVTSPDVMYVRQVPAPVPVPVSVLVLVVGEVVGEFVHPSCVTGRTNAAASPSVSRVPITSLRFYRCCSPRGGRSWLAGSSMDLVHVDRRLHSRSDRLLGLRLLSQLKCDGGGGVPVRRPHAHFRGRGQEAVVGGRGLVDRDLVV